MSITFSLATWAIFPLYNHYYHRIIRRIIYVVSAAHLAMRHIALFLSKLRLVIDLALGTIQVLRNADGGGGGVGWHIFWKKHYEGVMFNVISVTMGVQFPGK